MSAAMNTVSAVVEAEELAPLHALLDVAYPDNLRTIAEWLYVQLVEDLQLFGLATTPEHLDKLALVALRQTERLSAEEGGNALYLNKGVSYRATVRDREMYAQFKGNNINELARAHGITPNRVRQIVGAMLLLERAARQGRLDLD